MDMWRLVKPLSALAAACFTLGLIAILADRPVNAVPPAENLLPGFAEKIDTAHMLEIVHGRGMSGAVTLSFTRTPEGWVMRERDDYPAQQELVNETLLALAGLQTQAARTAQAKWHRALSLVVPEEFGKAIRFRVLDKDANVLADVLLGKEETSEVAAVQQVKQLGTVTRNFYVRLADSAQTWLARGRLPRNDQIGAWLDPSFPHQEQDQLAEVRFANGETRHSIERMPNGSWNKPGAERWLAGFSRLQLEDVSPDSAINFDAGVPLELHYTNGLIVRFESVGAATTLWTRARALVSDDKPVPDEKAQENDEAGNEAREIAAALNARFGGWALRLPTSAATQLMATAADLDN